MERLDTQPGVSEGDLGVLANGEFDDTLKYLQERFAGQDYQFVIMGKTLTELLARQDITTIPGATFHPEHTGTDNDNAKAMREVIVITEPVGRDIIDGLLSALGTRMEDGAYVAFNFLSYPTERRSDDGSRSIIMPLTLQEISTRAFNEGLLLHKYFGYRTYLDKCLIAKEENPGMTNEQAFEAARHVPDFIEPVTRVILIKGLDLSDLPVSPQ